MMTSLLQILFFFVTESADEFLLDKIENHEV